MHICNQLATCQVVSFCLWVWCVLDVFLLLTFTDLQHEYLDHKHLWDGMQGKQKGPWFTLSSDRDEDSHLCRGQVTDMLTGLVAHPTGIWVSFAQHQKIGFKSSTSSVTMPWHLNTVTKLAELLLLFSIKQCWLQLEVWWMTNPDAVSVSVT